MTRFSIFALLLVLPFLASAQEKEEKSITFYGFIRNAAYTDTYQGVDAVHDQFYLLPLYGGVDENGEDINQNFQSNFTAVASRLGIKATGPRVFNAKSSANMEFDFGGITSAYPSLFRIRHAYLKLDWTKSSLIAGQTWHPFWGDASFPHVGSLNTGAPFQAFNRSPQLRFDYKLNDNITLLGAAVYENQYTSKGFYALANDIDKTMPLRYSGTPELVALVKYKQGGFNMGLGAEYKSILPIDVLSPDGGITNYKTDITNKSYGLTAYTNYKNDKLYVLLKGTYGQNLTHLTMPGGYGVKSVDASTGAYDYTNYNNYSGFLNITYGKKWVAGLLLGYGGNLGTSDALVDVDGGGEKIAGLFATLQDMSRIAPSLTLNVSSFRICAEYEITSASYGKGNFDLSDGLYDDSFGITNHRMLLMMMYFF